MYKEAGHRMRDFNATVDIKSSAVLMSRFLNSHARSGDRRRSCITCLVHIGTT